MCISTVRARAKIEEAMGYGEPWSLMISFDDRLRAALCANLEAHERRAESLDGRRHAAVALVLVDSDPVRHAGGVVGVAGGAAFLLCQRSAGLRRHAGQWALPGGRVEVGETPLEAALRELDEELGIRLGPQTVVGWLDDYPTRSGYVITPVVLWGGSDPTMKPADDEVLAVYRVSLQALVDAEPRFVAIPESDRPVLQLPFGRHLLHAPTAAILYQLRQVGLLGHAGERVDHLELQPSPRPLVVRASSSGPFSATGKRCMEPPSDTPHAPGTNRTSTSGPECARPPAAPGVRHRRRRTRFPGCTEAGFSPGFNCSRVTMLIPVAVAIEPND